jgi:hypothetical protein
VSKKIDAKWNFDQKDSASVKYVLFQGVKLGDDAVYLIDTFYTDKKHLFLKVIAVDYPKSADTFEFGSRKTFLNPVDIMIFSASYDGSFYYKNSFLKTFNDKGSVRIRLRNRSSSYYIFGTSNQLDGLATLIHVTKINL